MVRRVERAGLVAHGGGRGRRSERAHGLEVAARVPRRGRAGLARSLLGAAARPAPHRRGAGRGDRRAAAVADDGGGDRRVPGDGALDGLGGADADRARQALAAGAARAAEPLRAQRAGRAAPHRRQEARSDRPAPGTASPATAARRTREASAGSSCTSASTTPPAWPTSRCSPTRRPRPRPASCAARSPSTAATGSPSSA